MVLVLWHIYILMTVYSKVPTNIDKLYIDKLYIDIGNTAIKWQYITQNSSVQNPSGKNVNNQALISQKDTINYSPIVSFLFEYLPNISDKAIILIACVAHKNLLTKIKQYYPKHLIKVAYTQKKHKNLINAYDEVEQLGVDRWLNLIAIYEKYPNKNVLLLSLGTATTLDILSAQAEHQGGLIMPSIDLMKQSLPKFSPSKMPNHQISPVLKNLSNNTQSAWHFGCESLWLMGVSALINQHKIGMDLIILTGGYADLLSSYLSNNHIGHSLEDNLVLTGLSLYLWDN